MTLQRLLQNLLDFWDIPACSTESYASYISMPTRSAAPHPLKQLQCASNAEIYRDDRAKSPVATTCTRLAEAVHLAVWSERGLENRMKSMALTSSVNYQHLKNNVGIKSISQISLSGQDNARTFRDVRHDAGGGRGLSPIYAMYFTVHISRFCT
jgi:hypothetical protein